MSVRWINAAWKTTTGAPSSKSVLLVLADHADEDGVCWPKKSTIAAKTELAESTVKAQLAVLEHQGLITRHPDFEMGGRQTSNVYQLHLDGNGRGFLPAGGGASSQPGEGPGEIPPTRTTRRNHQKEALPTVPAEQPSKPKRLVVSDNDTPIRPEDGDTQPSTKLQRTKSKKTAEEQAADQHAKYAACAARNGDTAFDQASRLYMGLRSKGDPGSVNVSAVAKQMNAWLREDGITSDLVRKMVDVFLSRPDAYTNDGTVPWVGFIGARQKLVTDARKRLQAKAPRKRAAVVYEDED